MKKIILSLIVLSSCLLFSCKSEPSLQKYFVDHQNDADFIAIDFPTSLLDTKKTNLTEEEQKSLERVKKINLLALQLKDSIDKDRYTSENHKIAAILDNEKYQTLMRFGSNGTKGVLKYLGENADIDEVIVYANNSQKGLALVRVLGDDIKPQNIIKLVNAIEKERLDLSQLQKALGKFNF